MVRLALGLLPLAVTASRVAAAQRPDSVSVARIDAVFSRFTTTSPGCALNVQQGGKPAYLRGYGLASLELGVPISTRTVFDIGSTSKQFTAASVALLALDGKLSLDDDIRKYVPELPDLGAKVTLRHLLTHTSGWRDYIDLMVFEGWDFRDHTTDRDALTTLGRQRALNFAPGTDYRYSNTGYFLLSLVVQRVAGQSLAQFARERIFEPLGMHDTHYLTDASEVIPTKATAYTHPGPRAWRIEMSNWEQIGDGGVQSTVEDLALWDANLTSGVVGGRPLRELLTTPGRLNDGTALTYALGLNVDEYHGLRRVWHGGAWAGYRTMLMRFPSEGLSILLACNVDDAYVTLFTTRVADVLLPRPVAAGAVQSPAAEGAGSSARQPDADPTRFAGIYFDRRVGDVVRLVADGGNLDVAGRGKPFLALGGPQFRDTAMASELRFDDANGGTMISRRQSLPPITYVRVAPSDTTHLSEYAGTYLSSEAAAEWTIVVRNGALVLKPRRGEEDTLRPLFRDAFAGQVVLRFERDSTGRVIALTATSLGVQELRFTRR